MRPLLLNVVLLLSCGVVAEAAAPEDCRASTEFFSSATASDLETCLTGSGKEAFLEARDKEFATILHLAAAYGSSPELLDVLRAAVDAEQWEALLGARTRSDLTALHLASREAENPDMVTRLLTFGADPDALANAVDRWRYDRGTTALHLAAEREDGTAFLSALLSGGADQTWYNEDGWPPLLTAARFAESPAPLAALLADPQIDADAVDGFTDDEGSGSLHVVTSYDKPLPVVRYLVMQGAEVDAANDLGWTPLHMAARFSTRPSVVEFLLENSQEPCLEDDNSRMPADYLPANESLAENVALERAFHEACREGDE